MNEAFTMRPSFVHEDDPYPTGMADAVISRLTETSFYREGGSRYLGRHQLLGEVVWRAHLPQEQCLGHVAGGPQLLGDCLLHWGGLHNYLALASGFLLDGD